MGAVGRWRRQIERAQGLRRGSRRVRGPAREVSPRVRQAQESRRGLVVERMAQTWALIRARIAAPRKVPAGSE